MQATTRNSLAVLVTTLVAGLAAWGAFALLLRWRRTRWWPFVGSAALAISIIGPSYLAGGTTGQRWHRG